MKIENYTLFIFLSISLTVDVIKIVIPSSRYFSD